MIYQKVEEVSIIHSKFNYIENISIENFYLKDEKIFILLNYLKTLEEINILFKIRIEAMISNM